MWQFGREFRRLGWRSLSSFCLSAISFSTSVTVKVGLFSSDDWQETNVWSLFPAVLPPLKSKETINLMGQWNSSDLKVQSNKSLVARDVSRQRPRWFLADESTSRPTGPDGQEAARSVASGSKSVRHRSTKSPASLWLVHLHLYTQRDG